MNRLTDKTALITGGSRGIGEAIALRLAREGANIAVCASQSTEAAEGVAEKIRAQGREALVQQTDVANAESVDALVKTVLGHLGQN